MSTYFFVIFEVHYTVSRYSVCLEKYLDLSLRLRSGTTSEDIEPMRRMRSRSQIFFLNNTLTYSSIQQNTKLATTLLLQWIHIFSILDAPYIEPL